MAPELPDTAQRLLTAGDDALGAEAHVGVLVPWANSVVEAELGRLGLPNIVWHYARLVPDNQATALDDGFLTGLLRVVPSSIQQLRHLPLRAIAIACTSAGFSFPADTKAAGNGQAVPVYSAYDALISVLGRLRLRRIVLCAPYPPELTAREADAFAASGLEVLAWSTLGRRDGFAGISDEEVAGLLDVCDRSAVAAAEAVVLSCTAWSTLATASEMEARLGRPVLSSNLALAIEAASVAAKVGPR